MASSQFDVTNHRGCFHSDLKINDLKWYRFDYSKCNNYELNCYKLKYSFSDLHFMSKKKIRVLKKNLIVRQTNIFETEKAF